MLQRLTVRNYALIDRLEIDLSSGMNIITGETGAGKSILLGALGLILGQRAESDALLDKSAKCIVEGTFKTGKSKSIKAFLKENDLDTADPVLVRREVSPEGKSRSFINDTPVNLQQLKEFTGLLVDIHSQHQTLLLNKADFQLSVMDALAGTETLLDSYRESYASWRSAKAEVTRLQEAEQQAIAEQDYLRFQYSELEEAALKSGEQELLEKELAALTNAGDINTRLEQAFGGLTGGESNLVS
ncbi:MAG: repair protein RecN, partial [Bacteroidota bacterium]